MKNLRKYEDYTFSDTEYNSKVPYRINVKKDFLKACREQDLETIKELLAHAAINIKTVKVALSQAVDEFYKKSFKELIKYPGIELSDDAQQMLRLAIVNGYDDNDIIDLLLSRPDFDATVDNHVALKFANKCNNRYALELLLANEDTAKDIANIISFDNMNSELKSILMQKFELDDESDLKEITTLMRG